MGFVKLFIYGCYHRLVINFSKFKIFFGCTNFVQPWLFLNNEKILDNCVLYHSWWLWCKELLNYKQPTTPCNDCIDQSPQIYLDCIPRGMEDMFCNASSQNKLEVFIECGSAVEEVLGTQAAIHGASPESWFPRQRVLLIRERRGATLFTVSCKPHVRQLQHLHNSGTSSRPTYLGCNGLYFSDTLPLLSVD